MTELSGAVLLAQLRKLDGIISLMHEKKTAFKNAISGGKGYSFAS